MRRALCMAAGALAFVALFALTEVGTAQGPGPGPGPVPGEDELVSVVVTETEAPVLDGQASDPAWARAPTLEVSAVELMMGPAPSPGETTEIQLRSVHTESDVYLLAEWPDETMSIDKAVWERDADGWRQLDANEDRLAILWNLDRTVQGFDSLGCMAACHVVGPGMANGRMHTGGPGQYADQWQWKAARTSPMRRTDDQYLDDTEDPSDDEAAHKGDTGQSTYVDNVADDAPGWAWSSSEPSAPPGVADELAARFLLMAEADALGPTNPLTGASWAAGDRVPGYALREAEGSRGDIEAHGRWTDGTWTVEIRRALDTGDHGRDGDVLMDQQFSQDGTYQFGVAVWDNAHGVEHRHARGPYRLRFEAQAPTATPTTEPGATPSPATAVPTSTGTPSDAATLYLPWSRKTLR